MANFELGSLVWRVQGDTQDFDKKIGGATTRLGKFADRAKQIGGSLTKFVTLPLAGAAAGFVALADKQAQAEASLTNAIRATGREAEISVKSLGAFASELQATTTFGDEAQLSALALTQQLANLDERGLKQVLPGMLDFSTAMGIDLQSAASLVGKTLGSSTNALARYGIELDTTLSPTEKLAALTEQLEDKFGGAAEAAAEAGLGSLKQLKNSAGDLAESFGELLLPSLNRAIDAVQGVVDWFADLDDGTKKLITAMGVLAASSGPIILAIGALAKLKAAIIAINTAALFGPAGIIVGLAAVTAGLISIGRARRRSQLEEIAEEFGDIKTTAGLAAEEIEAIEQALRLGSMDGFSDASEQVDALAKNLGISKAAVVDIGLASDNVTKRYKEQLQVLKDQFTEQMAISAAMEDQWLANERERAAADARSAEILRQREEEEERIAQRRAEIQDRADEAYTSIERRLEEINRLEAFNLRIGEDYNAEAEKRKAVLDEINRLIFDGIGLNTSFAGALDFIEQQYGDILQLTKDINDEAGSGDGEDAAEERFQRDAEFISRQRELRLREAKAARREAQELTDLRIELFGTETEKFERNLQKQVAQYREAGLTLVEIQQFVADERARFAEENRDNEIENAETLTDALGVSMEDRIRQSEEGYKEFQRLRERDLEAEREALAQKLDAYEKYAGQVESVLGNLTQIRLNIIDTETQAKIAALNKEELGEEKYAEAVEAIREEAAIQAWEAEMKLFALRKAANVAQIAMDTASAIVRAYKELGPVAGTVAAAILGALGATQAGVVLSEPPPPKPAFALGGEFITNGPQDIRVGDNPGGRERVKVEPLSSPGLDESSGGVTVVVNTALNTDSQKNLERAARVLFPYLQREGARRG